MFVRTKTKDKQMLENLGFARTTELKKIIIQFDIKDQKKLETFTYISTKIQRDFKDAIK